MVGALYDAILIIAGSMHVEFVPPLCSRRRPGFRLFHLPVVLLFSSCFPAACDLSFVAIGDWGGESSEAPSTPSQIATAWGLVSTARALHADFALMMGDNLYQHGVLSSAEASGRFEETFEKVYPRHLPGTTFYALAGNHDYGEGEAANVSAQVAYTEMSQSWHFPALWYKVHRDFEAGTGNRSLDLLVIDTVSLCGMESIGDERIDSQLEFLGQAAYAGQPGRLRREVAEAQWTWLEKELAVSRADYLWVSGHFPIWSLGVDGSTPCLIDRLRPLLMKYGAHYISGHDHNLEHIRYEGLDTFVVGAGKECCYSPVNIDTVPPGAAHFYVAGPEGSESQPALPFPVLGGFASLRFGAEISVVTLHAHNGTALYEAPPFPRRTLSSKSHALVSSVRLLKATSGLEFAAMISWVAITLAFSVAASICMAGLFARKRRGAMASEFFGSVQQPSALG